MFRVRLGNSSKKKTVKSDIVHIWVLTHPTLSISDIQFSDIFFKVQTHPTLRISDIKIIFVLLSEIIYSLFINLSVRLL